MSITFNRNRFENLCVRLYRETMLYSQPGHRADGYELALGLAVLIGSHGPRWSTLEEQGAADWPGHRAYPEQP